MRWHDANRLQGGGEWSCTRRYSAADLAELEGGRYAAWRIETNEDGTDDGWRDDVIHKISRGQHGSICVTVR